MGALIAPLPASAAPAPCEQAERYAAQSGAELIRVEKLDLGPAGRTDKPINGIGLGDAKSALVAQSTVNSAALARMLNGGPKNRKDLAEIVQQTAPPSHQAPKRRTIKASDVGPFSLGRGDLSAHARWSAGMACGATAGEATRAKAALSRAGLLQDGDNALVRVPGGISGLSTTGIERRGSDARSVASASFAGGSAEVLGAVRIKVIKAPSLLATMSTGDGGEIRYLPPVLEVSADGIETARLDTAGDSVEVVLDEGDDGDDDGRDAADGPGAGRDRSGGGADQGGASGNLGGGGLNLGGNGLGILGAAGGGGKTEAGDDAARRDPGDADGSGTAGRKPKTKKKPKADKPGLLNGLPKLGNLTSLAPVPLPGAPSLPGLPVINEPPAESTPAGAPGTRVVVSLGDVRQAASGHAIAAKATAIRIVVTKGPDRTAYGNGRGGVVLDLGMGLLEAAAVSPEPVGGGTPGVVNGVGGGGLPITGPRVDVIALTGMALLIAGIGALVFGLRGRSRR